MTQIQHRPVLLQEVLASLPPEVLFVVDGTLGHGGHTKAILDQFPHIHLLGIDRDPSILEKTKAFLTPYGGRFESCLWSYADTNFFLKEKKADYILLDIGVNMEHYKDTSRGFSIKGEAPLDMRFDPTQWISAREWITKVKPEELAQCFITYAEFTETKAQELAHAIVRARNLSAISTTRQLRQVLYDCGLGDPASSVIFQAIRIQINAELEQLRIFLEKLPTLLAPGGRCAIITFHSIEDRMVKLAFKDLLQKGWNLITKKAIQPNYKEVQQNKASRSAKLRVIEKK